MSKVRLIAISKVVADDVPGEDAQSLIAYCARVSNPANQGNPSSEKLLNYCMEHKHWSVFEMANATLEIATTRDIARQILRHRSFSYQEFCISGDSLISLVHPSGKVIRRSIAQLYSEQTDSYASRRSRKARVYDERVKKLLPVEIKEVFQTGTKPVHLVTLENGKSLKTTMEHKFLTPDGFKPLQELSVGSIVGVNGIPVYQSCDWMRTAKEEAIREGTGVQGIADRAGVGYQTIRKWLKKLGMQFTKKEVAQYTPIWNKGLPAEEQPAFGKHATEATRAKHRLAAKRGVECNLYTSGVTPWRKSITAWAEAYRLELLNEQEGKCAECGESLELQIDHKLPVSQAPELAYERSNLQLLCKRCHRDKSTKEVAETVKWTPIRAIEYVGDEMTYDMEVCHPSHNYVANGFVVHNSQRYANPTELQHEIREARLQDSKNRQNSLPVEDEDLQDSWEIAQEMVWEQCLTVYQAALDKGIAKEAARAVLPEGMTPSRMYMNGSIRSWLHYCEVRTGPETQKEHREIARQCAEALSKEVPLFERFL